MTTSQPANGPIPVLANMRHAAVFALAWSVLPALAPAQTGHPTNQIPPTRTEFTFHIYADAMFGDNVEATARNPVAAVTPGRLRPLDPHQDPGELPADPHPIAGVLQHAPCAFKTLTGANGAIAYARQFLPVSVTPHAFWTNVVTFDPPYGQLTLTIRHVVIHCLPGLYGPIDEQNGLPRIDPVSGIPFNGENWGDPLYPATIPSFLSIQGTSALDTIFDARGLSTFILDVPAAADVPPGSTRSHEESFIDSVTLRNAHEGEQGAWGAGAAIYARSRGLYPEVPALSSTFRITNCFIVNNAVGIGVDSYVAGGGLFVAQRLRVLNNTIAWNGIGIWSGNTGAPGESQHELLVVNNIFDTGSPPAFRTGLSGFEGVSALEREVDSRGPAPNQILFTPPVDTNAWEAGSPARVNNGATLVNWPATTPVAGTVNGPVVDIRPYTTGATRPGCLYINDIFRATHGTDYSPHDFRLAPMVTDDLSIPPGLQPSYVNPLVNRGIGQIAGPSNFPIRMRNNQQLAGPPGLPATAEGRLAPATPTRVDGWDYDGEGFGNPRDIARTGFPANPRAYLGEMDVGADEMGLLIIAWFFDGTRILSPDPVPNATLAGPHGGIYFFDLPGPPGGWNRPVTNIYAGGYPYWFDHVQSGIDAEVGNYTSAWWIGSNDPLLPCTRNQLVFSGWNPFMRGLECDFTPHLVPDLHPFWGGVMEERLVPPFWAGDIYAANPWYDDPAQANPSLFPAHRGRFDNPALFYNWNATGYTASTSWFQWLSAPMYVRDATLNPPGTYPLGTRWTLDPIQVFGPYTPCGGTSPYTYNVGAWGFGDSPASCPDQVPGVAFGGGTLLLSALRFNCEQFPGTEQFPDGSNLQTFLGIRTPAPVEGLGAAGHQFQQSAGTRIRPTERPTREQLRQIVREVMER